MMKKKLSTKKEKKWRLIRISSSFVLNLAYQDYNIKRLQLWLIIKELKRNKNRQYRDPCFYFFKFLSCARSNKKKTLTFDLQIIAYYYYWQVKCQTCGRYLITEQQINVFGALFLSWLQFRSFQAIQYHLCALVSLLFISKSSLEYHINKAEWNFFIPKWEMLVESLYMRVSRLG